MQPFTDFDSYFSLFPKEVQERLQTIREVIHQLAPEAKEVISYQMPAFKLNRVFIYFAAYKKHIGLYPTATGIAAFKHELGDYTWSKGAIQFPHSKPLPMELIGRIIVFKLNEDKLNIYPTKSV